MKSLFLLLAATLNISTAMADDLPGFQMPALETYAEVTARPLFSPDRRPREAAPIEAGAGTAIALKGIVINGTTRYAVIEEGTPVAPKRVAEGQAVDAGTIKRISRDHIILTMRGGTDAIVKLFESAKQTEAHPSDGAAAQTQSPIPPEFVKNQVSRTPLTAGSH